MSNEGLSFSRAYTAEGVDPLDTVDYKKVDVSIKSKEGIPKFEQNGVEVPTTWQMAATETAAEKYFRRAGVTEDDGGEYSARQLVGRVSRAITRYGTEGGYFNSEQDADTFRAELSDILINQRAAFNSPVWFNVGLDEYGIQGTGGRGFFYDESTGEVKPTFDSYTHPQGSACFIQSIEDTLFAENEGENGIYDLLDSETRLFELGSGTGTNFSPIRGEGEPLSSGGESSGLMSFLQTFDRNARTIKSGGKTRRAAKMVVLDADHPEIMDFIGWKAREEEKARVLLDAGYGEYGDLESEAYDTVSGQNSNNSVRVNDTFMQAVTNDEEWQTIERTTGKARDTYKARDLWDAIAQAAHQCADPGLQFDTTINEWHTCKETDKIHSSNPCSEYMFLNDSACNLASLNLMKYRQPDGALDIDKFKHDIDVVLTAQEILVGQSSYPTASIAKNSRDFRPLGLGYANLGALLLANGLPYDSDEGRALAAGITSLMTGRAYHHSAKMADTKGAFEGFEKNKEPFMEVMKKHQSKTSEIDSIEGVTGLEGILDAANEEWESVISESENGFRNAQVSVLAPTGTIGFLMDCDTTGIEPDYALMKHKKMIGGGFREIVNQQVPTALETLGYSPDQVEEIRAHISSNNGNVEGAPHLNAEHYAVFDTADKPMGGSRSISPMGHIKMMAAVQPFLSGAISKTVNLPNDATVEDIADTYMQAWKLGLKSIALYRDGSKVAQPLNKSGSEEGGELEEKLNWGDRKMMPLEREGTGVKTRINGNGIFIQTGEYEDGSLGELSISMAKSGSEYNNLLDGLSIAISKGLQFGVPLQEYVDTFRHVKSERGGMTTHPNIPMVSSPMDFVMRWLAMHYDADLSEANVKNDPDPSTLRVNVLKARREMEKQAAGGNIADPSEIQTKGDESSSTGISTGTGEFCADCGEEMVKNGTCFKCINCHGTSGCS